MSDIRQASSQPDDRDPRTEPGRPEPDPEVRDDLRADSAALLRAADRLRALELEKRGLEISTPAFHDRADEIEDVAREVFGFARRERIHGEEAAAPLGTTIEDEPDEDG